ncbi:MAG: hypothetical protein ACR2PL_04570 [Dehalococcoidia bacterium]
MDITFLRVGEQHSAAMVLRDDGVTIRVPGFGPGDPLPHDLAHYVVEREFGLQQGFWASVAAGAVFPGMALLSGRRRPHATERAQAVIRENGPCITQAEVLVGEFVEMIRQNRDQDSGAALARLMAAQSTVRCGAIPMARTDLVNLCARLLDAASKWQAAAADGHLTVHWRSPASHRLVRLQRDRRRGFVQPTR